MASAGPISISGRKSSGRQKMVREVKDKLFLLNSAWKVMEKRRKEGRKQIYYSSKFTQVLSTQTSHFSLPSALLWTSSCHPPDITRAVIQPSTWRWAQERGMCVSVCAFLLVLCMTRAWLQSSRASAPNGSSQQNLPAITGTVTPHPAVQCTTLCLGPGSNVFEDFPLIKPSQGNHDKVVCPCLRHTTD